MQLIPDKINATYWWKINLDNSHPRNNPNIKAILGYSKFQNQSEAVNKIQCFCSKVEMLVKHGYLERSNSIVIYEKVGALPSVQHDRALIVLYKNDYKFNPELIGNIHQDIKIFMSKLYQVINTGKPVENLRPLKTPVIKDDILYKNKYFKDIKTLYDYCEKLISGGENRNQVQNFYRNYILKNFDINTPGI